MKTTHLTLLGIATIVVIGGAAAVVQSRHGSSKSSADDRGRLFPSLEDRVNDVREIEITQGTDHLTIRREGGQWGVVERGGYPAKFEQVKQAILGVAQLEIDELKTSRPENHAKLGVEEPGEGSEAAKIVLRDGEGTELAAVIAGEPQYRGRTQMVYVRQPGDDQTYLCEGRLDTDATPGTWMNREVIRLDSNDLVRVRVHRADGEELLVEKTDPLSNQFEVRGVPIGRTLRYASAANSVATVLASLYVDDVKPMDEVDFTVEPLARTEFERADGEVLVVETAKQGDTTWARIHSRYEAPPEPPAPADTLGPEPAPADDAAAAEGGEGVDEAEQDPAELAREVQERIEASNAKHTGWAYAIPSYKAENLAKSMEDLLAPLEPPAEESAEAVPADDTTPPEAAPASTDPASTDPGATDDGATDAGSGAEAVPEVSDPLPPPEEPAPASGADGGPGNEGPKGGGSGDDGSGGDGSGSRAR